MNKKVKSFLKLIEKDYSVKLEKKYPDGHDSEMNAVNKKGIIIGQIDVYEIERMRNNKVGKEIHIGMRGGCFTTWESGIYIMNLLKKFNEENY